jgi:hypothetical protein
MDQFPGQGAVKLSVDQRKTVGQKYGWCFLAGMQEEIPILVSSEGSLFMVHLGKRHSPDDWRGEVEDSVLNFDLLEVRGTFNKQVSEDQWISMKPLVEEALLRFEDSHPREDESHLEEWDYRVRTRLYGDRY